MIRFELAPYTVSFEDLESARDFLILATDAQRLVKLGRVGVRRLEPPRSSGPKTLDDIAERHARVPVRIAEPSERPAPSEPAPLPAPRAPRRRREPSPLLEHLAADVERVAAPIVEASLAPRDDGDTKAVPVEPMGRRTGTNTKRINEATKSAALLEIVKRGTFDVRAAARELYKVDDLYTLQRVQALLTVLRKQGLVENPARGQWVAVGQQPPPAREAPSASKHATMEDLFDHVLKAFGSDEEYPINSLAFELFRESTGRTVQKTRLVIEQLVARGKLERHGLATFRVVDEDEDKSASEPEDNAGDDQDDEVGFTDDELDAVASG